MRRISKRRIGRAVNILTMATFNKRLEKELGECEKLKVAAERGLRAAENLRKAILAEAFE